MAEVTTDQQVEMGEGHALRQTRGAAGELNVVRQPRVLTPPVLSRRLRFRSVAQGDDVSERKITGRVATANLPMNRRCLEVRHVDSATNFYLSSAMILAAGLSGIRDQLDAGEPCEINTYDYSESQLAQKGIHRLPKTLGEAIDAFAKDDFAKEVMGEEFHGSYVRYKQREWEDYRLTVGEWEEKRYLHAS